LRLRTQSVAWLLCGAAVAFYAIAWRAWQPYASIYQSHQRAEDLKRELRERRMQEIELRYRLATLPSPAGMERVAVARGLGPPDAVALRPVWRAQERPASKRSLPERTKEWAQRSLGRPLRGLRRLSGREEKAEPAKRSLTLP